MTKIFGFCWLLMLCLPLAAQTVFSVRGQEAAGDMRERYNTELINLALAKTQTHPGDYQIKPIPSMNTPRSLFAAALNIYPNLLIEMSYEPKLSAKGDLTFIPFPVDLGMVGYRVCFVSPEAREAVTRVRTLEDLRQFTIGQGMGWMDTQILRHNGLKVVEVGNYASLFRMVAAGRIDLFCRGINEISNEQKAFANIKRLQLDQHLLLAYPLPRFYYLGSQNKAALMRIQKGLQLAYEDGSLLKLWQQNFLTGIAALNLHQRLLLRLENPLLNELDNSYLKYDLNPLDLSPD